MSLVKSEQYLCDLVAGVFGFSSQPEAIAKIPRLVVKRRTVPAKTLDRTITQDNETACVMGGLPACSSLPATLRVIFVCFHAPGCPTVSEQGRLAKKDSGL